MSGSADNNKRLFKNTAILYIRMAIVMLISLYTSRVILLNLGVEDFGIYNVVCGIAILFVFINGGMGQANLRFLSRALSENNHTEFNHIFNVSQNVHCILALIIVLLAETVGLWFLNTKLNIPELKYHAANWAYQFALFTCLGNILIAPYNASIIAFEKFSFVAYSSIVLSVGKLCIALLIAKSSTEKLIFYAGLMFGLNALIQIITVIYCKLKFSSFVKYHFCRDRILFYKLISFSGWSLCGNFADMCNSQGINMAINIFCGVACNAAWGIANQVNGAIYQFVTNFQTAFRPQILKLYGDKTHDEFINLVIQSSKLSYWLMLFLALPLCLNLDWILSVWLKVVPPYTKGFVLCIIANSIVDSVSAPLWMSIQANGNIQKYQVIISSFYISSLLVSIAVLACGLSPVVAIASKAFINFCSFIWRIFFLQNRIGISAKFFLIQVCLRVVIVTIVATLLPVAIYFTTINMNGLNRILISGAVSCISIALCIYCLGLKNHEREYIINFIKSKTNIFLYRKKKI